MLNSNEWWKVIENYNQSIFPLQWIILLVGLLVTLYMFFGNRKKASTLMKTYLCLTNLFIGMVFFLVLGTGFRPPLNYIQAGVFIAIGVLFGISMFSKRTVLEIPQNGSAKSIAIIMLILVAFYPFIGIMLGNPAERLLLPGTLPCPTTALGLTILTASFAQNAKQRRIQINIAVLVLLLVWAIPFPPLVQIPKYGVYEDGIMFSIGLYALLSFVATSLKRKRVSLKNHASIFQIKKDAVFATMSPDGVPNIVPIHSKHLLNNKKVLISDQFMQKTKENVLHNPIGVLTIRSDDALYEMRGICQYKSSGFLYKMAVRGAKKYAEKHASNKSITIRCKGIVLMQVEEISITKIRSDSKPKALAQPTAPKPGETIDREEILSFFSQCPNCFFSIKDGDGNLQIYRAPFKAAADGIMALSPDADNSFAAGSTVSVAVWKGIIGYQLKGRCLPQNEAFSYIGESVALSKVITEAGISSSRAVLCQISKIYCCTPGKLAGQPVYT